MERFLLQLFIFFVSSTIAVPIAKKLGLGSVLGYLIAGIVIGPFGLSLIADVESVMHYTEFGVVMMLFLVGLELKPSMLYRMRVPILGTGGLQVILSALVIGGIGYIFLPWKQALSVGLALALSSTAIVVQTLKEKSLLDSKAGRSIFSVLLFQDLAVIPMLALIPLLGTATHGDSSHAEVALVDISQFSGGVQVIFSILALLLIYLLGRYASKPIFRIIAGSNVREIFVASALGFVVGISLLMTIVGLSPALGTFMAGVVLADSEYRHELESDIEPFKGLLLGVFFISIGASLNFTLIKNNLATIIAITIGLIVLKFLVLLIIGKIFKMESRDKTFLAISLAQGGEFAFVLFRIIASNGVMTVAETEPFVSAVAISMFLAPVIFKVYEKVANNRAKEEKENAKMDTVHEKGKRVIIAGFGMLGTDIGRLLLATGIKPVILDNDAQHVKVLRKFGFEVYYGDVSRLDLLAAAGASEAEVLVLTMSDMEASKKLVHLVKKHYPNLKIVSNANNLKSTYDLMDMKVDKVRGEAFGTAMMLGKDVLQLLGKEPFEAYRLTRVFANHNDKIVNRLYLKQKNDSEDYISAYREQMDDLEELMNSNFNMDHKAVGDAWTEW